MIRACASRCIPPSRADANFSNSSRDSDPNSLQGGRCNVSSMTPLFNSQERAWPWNLSMMVRNLEARNFRRSENLRRLLYPIHLLDFIAHTVCDQIALEFPIHCQQTIFNGKRLRRDAESAHLFVVRQLRI